MLIPIAVKRVYRHIAYVVIGNQKTFLEKVLLQFWSTVKLFFELCIHFILPSLNTLQI